MHNYETPTSGWVWSSTHWQFNLHKVFLSLSSKESTCIIMKYYGNYNTRTLDRLQSILVYLLRLSNVAYKCNESSPIHVLDHNHITIAPVNPALQHLLANASQHNALPVKSLFTLKTQVYSINPPWYYTTDLSYIKSSRWSVASNKLHTSTSFSLNWTSSTEKVRIHVISLVYYSWKSKSSQDSSTCILHAYNNEYGNANNNKLTGPGIDLIEWLNTISGNLHFNSSSLTWCNGTIQWSK